MIVARDVVRSFGSVTAVAGVSLEVRAGEVVGLVGANGAGKTTLIRVLLGLLTPDGGRVELAGAPPTPEGRRRVGYVPQHLGLWPDLTLAEHLELAAAAYGTEEALITDPVLARSAGRPVGELALGVRRRAAFLLALSHRPSALVLDEPTSGVDALARVRLWEMIRVAAGGGAAVLVSTHHFDEASRCDRIVLLDAGRVVAHGTVPQLVAGHTCVQVVAGGWQDTWRRLDAAGYAVLPSARALRVVGAEEDDVRRTLTGLDVRLETVPAGLEELFLALVSQ